MVYVPWVSLSTLHPQPYVNWSWFIYILEFIIGVGLIVWLTLAWYVGYQASLRGRSFSGWFLLVAITGIIGVVIYLLVATSEPIEREREQRRSSSASTADINKKGRESSDIPGNLAGGGFGLLGRPFRWLGRSILRAGNEVPSEEEVGVTRRQFLASISGGAILVFGWFFYQDLNSNDQNTAEVVGIDTLFQHDMPVVIAHVTQSSDEPQRVRVNVWIEDQTPGGSSNDVTTAEQSAITRANPGETATVRLIYPGATHPNGERFDWTFEASTDRDPVARVLGPPE